MTPRKKSFHKEHWNEGDEAFFEYRCLESFESSDACAWLRSHSLVIVIAEVTADELPGSTFKQRGEVGMPKLYEVEFGDGFIYSAFEDELLTSPEGYICNDPPDLLMAFRKAM